MIKDSEILGVFDPPPTNWAVQAYRVDWTGLNESALLEADVYETTMTYDGLSRPISVELPLDLDSERKVVEPTYNRSGAMESISLDGEVYVSRIAYNAKGQRVLMAYGNDIMTRYAYDPVNFRLLRQRSEEFVNPSGFPLTYEAQSGSTRQDCEYTFDLAGNIVNMVDDSPNAGVGGTGSLSRDFSYDALYRLLTATGRESGGFANSSTPWDDGFYVPDDSHANTRAYTRTYTYDELGNMLSLNHNAGTGNTFNRTFNQNQTNPYRTSNLCDEVTYGSTTVSNSFDDNGNMTSEGSSRHFEWDFADRMRVYRTQTGTSEPTVYAHYLYDAGGVRVKKIVRKSSGNHEVTVYIDGVFEYLYEVNSSSTRTEEKNEIHVMDGRSRIARREVYAGNYNGDMQNPVKYVMEDHLGNASFTLTASGTLLHREEYFPFGETSFGSYTKKRYRFCGKERDEESGLYYYGARYYMPWQCRFVSVDPLAAEYPFYTPYQYAGNKPIIAIDLDGLEEVISEHVGTLSTDANGGRMIMGSESESGENNINFYDVTVKMRYMIVADRGFENTKIDSKMFSHHYSIGNRKLSSDGVTPGTINDNGGNNILTVKYDYQIEGEGTLREALEFYGEDKIGRGIIFSMAGTTPPQILMDDVETHHPIPNDIMGSEGAFDPISILANTHDILRADASELGQYHEMLYSFVRFIERRPVRGFSDPMVGGISELNQPNYIAININTDMYGSKSTMPVNSDLIKWTLIAIHEAGHNAARNHGHGSGSYEYNQAGLQSNGLNPYPTKQNTISILNEPSNWRRHKK